MIRAQVQLSEQQAEAVRELADRRRVRVADLIRQAVDEYLRAAEAVDRKRRALADAGRFHSGHGDLSVDHDRHLAQAFGE